MLNYEYQLQTYDNFLPSNYNYTKVTAIELFDRQVIQMIKKCWIILTIFRKTLNGIKACTITQFICKTMTIKYKLPV